MKSNFSIIEDKLNEFVRKFYSNRIVQGILLFVAVALLSLFSVFMVESFAFMSPNIKTFLFYALLFLFVSIFIFFILIPGGKLLKIIPFLSHEEAAKIISAHFPESKDLLLNILQLNRNQDSDLIVAAINQKSALISPLNFNNAIDYRKTFKFLTIALIILLASVLIAAIFTDKIKDGSTRFINYNTFYQPENPYSISILNNSLECPYGEDFTLRLKLSGPSEIYDIYIQNEQLNLRMSSDSSDFFSYSFKNVNQNLSFRLNYLGFLSDTYSINVIHKPSVFVSRVTIIPPSYTNLESNEIEVASDFSAPFGSKIVWNLSSSFADSVFFYVDSSLVKSDVSQETFNIEKMALKSFDYNYSAIGEGGFTTSSDLFRVNILPDYNPQIVAVSLIDSSSANGVFFQGRISDDYGFYSLTFNYFDHRNPKHIYSKSLKLNSNASQNFYYYFDFDGFSDAVSYYFEVKDNDVISGFKSAKTPLSVFTTITDEEKQQRVDNLNSSIFDKIDETQRLLRELGSDLREFQKSISSNDQISDYEKQLKLNNLMEKRGRLQSLLEEVNQDNQSKNAFENQLSPDLSEELMAQQKMLQQLWDELLTDDIKELLDKLNEMAKSLSEKNLRDNIQDLKFDFNQISEQLNRNQDLLKMYNVDKNIQDLSRDLSQMAKDYNELSKELQDYSDNNSDKISKRNDKKSQNKPKSDKYDSNNNPDSDASDFKDKPLSDKIDEFKKKFEDKKSLYEETKRLNEELGDSHLDINDVQKQFDDLLNSLDFQQSQMSELDKEMGKMSPDSSKDNPNSTDSDVKNGDDLSREAGSDDQSDAKSGSDQGDKTNNQFQMKSQKQRQDDIRQQMEESSEELEKLSEKLSSGSKQSKQKKNQENLNDIRQILDNLVTVSFNQESLLTKLKGNSNSVFLATEVLLGQNSIVKDFSLVQDSIYALAKREPQLGHAVYEKIDNIHSYFNKTLGSINENRRGEAMNFQQILLTNLNDLSLIFSEIQDQMQNQEQQDGQQSDDEQQQTQSKNKKELQQRQKTTQQMKSQQQTLKQNLEKMLQQLHDGDKPSSQKLAESLRQQELMMQQLREMQNGGGISPEEQRLMNQMQQMMEENKRDIVNKNITRRTIDRQNTLFNKLLELEKAEKSQELEEKRESKQGSDFQQNNANDLNLKFKDFGVKEYIHSSPINLNLFYQNLYNDYIQNIE